MTQQVYFPVTPAALGANVIAPALSAIWVGVTGSLAIRGLRDGVVCTLPNVPVGFLTLPYPVSEVIALASLAGTVSVTNGQAAITFSQAQTLPQGAAVVFASQPGTTYYLAAAVNGSTSATLTTNYSGTTNAATTTQTGTTASGLVGCGAGGS